MTNSIHGIFPNYCDGTWVSHTFLSLLENMQNERLHVKGIVGSKAKCIKEAYVSALLPLKLQRLLIMLGWKSSPEALLSLMRLKHFREGDIAYLWLANPPEFSANLKKKKVMVVREMINCTLAKRRAELSKAYLAFDNSQFGDITDDAIANERQQLISADYIFCPNPYVKQSVMDYGVPEWRCLDCSYGWSEDRINGDLRALPEHDGITIVFAGTVDVRKGAPTLMQAWAKAGVKGRLVLAGQIAENVKKQCADLLSRDDIICLGHVEDIGSVYRSADIFCFPSWEEGGPIVTIEAMSQRLPVIVTPMGTSGIFTENEGIGLIVPPGDVEALIKAIQLLANDEQLRKTMGVNAKQRADLFTWQHAGKKRSDLLLAKHAEWSAGNTVKT